VRTTRPAHTPLTIRVPDAAVPDAGAGDGPGLNRLICGGSGEKAGPADFITNGPRKREQGGLEPEN
jgi:hypothetical protein